MSSVRQRVLRTVRLLSQAVKIGMESEAALSLEQGEEQIQRKYANDKEILNIKMMELYKEEKFNPMKGCLPLLIQLPIIWGLFGLLRNPMKYISGDGMLTAIHESFLWIPDLSQPDPWILPILAGISTFFSFIISQAQTQSVAADNPMGSSMKMMKYFFPIMIIWMGKAMPAGLTLYWFFGTTIQVVLSQILNVWNDRDRKSVV